eukprot:gnl/TRDRNA2_/TRDRNA2_186265_c0_seq1.p1 gnl/TRDRNA2_/TRDRNA2_186265_c0~~gnl/TRDRNA2_/TRDRNA2_186265_c0_seq1.p1  ORF type:complete len:100 (+),score=8.82 gnl/TRDRNA2_/TRDRNA2_186265_c0_seq1:67-366(+)
MSRTFLTHVSWTCLVFVTAQRCRRTSDAKHVASESWKSFAFSITHLRNFFRVPKQLVSGPHMLKPASLRPTPASSGACEGGVGPVAAPPDGRSHRVPGT